jgi:hypothetical protein
MIKVTGNTYSARNLLRDCGFAWDAKQRAYLGDESARAENKSKNLDSTRSLP